MQIKLISLTIVEDQDSLRNRDKQQLGNGPLPRHSKFPCVYAVFRFCTPEGERKLKHRHKEKKTTTYFDLYVYVYALRLHRGLDEIKF